MEGRDPDVGPLTPELADYVATASDFEQMSIGELRTWLRRYRPDGAVSPRQLDAAEAILTAKRERRDVALKVAGIAVAGLIGVAGIALTLAQLLS